MEEKILTVKAWSVPSNVVAFTILKDGEPAAGSKVNLITKGAVPQRFEATADAEGRALFTDIVPVTPEAFKQIPWLLTAYLEESEYAVWKDQAYFELGQEYEFKLKKYVKAPTFFVKLQLRDIIGVEHFSNFIAEIEKKALETAGLEVVKISGQGTKTVEVQFRPPWHSSPLVISWTAVWFILKVMAVAAAIIAILVVLKWTFGAVKRAGVGLGIVALVLLLLKQKGRRAPKRRR